RRRRRDLREADPARPRSLLRPVPGARRTRPGGRGGVRDARDDRYGGSPLRRRDAPGAPSPPGALPEDRRVSAGVPAEDREGRVRPPRGLHDPPGEGGLPRTRDRGVPGSGRGRPELRPAVRDARRPRALRARGHARPSAGRGGPAVRGAPWGPVAADRVPDALRDPPGPPAAPRPRPLSGQGVHPVRYGVVSVPDAAAGRAAGQPVVLRTEPGEDGEMTETRKVAFLGGGKMAEALLSGLIRASGRKSDELMATCRREERATELADR